MDSRRRLAELPAVGPPEFGGFGGIAPLLSSIDDTELLPPFGLGLRFMPIKAANTNVRVDNAYGKDGGELFVCVGEAFQPRRRRRSWNCVWKGP